MPSSKNITINTLSQSLGKLVVVILGTLTTIILRRSLGRQVYGDYIFVISVATMLSTLADFGSHLIAVKEASQKQTDQKAIIANVIFLRLVICLVAMIVMVVLALIPRFSRNLQGALLAGSLIILAISFKDSLVIIFHTKMKLFYFALMNSLVSIFAFLGIISTVLLGKTREVLILVLVLGISNLLSALIFTPLANRLIPLRINFNPVIIKRFLRQTAPMAGILLLFTLYSKIDTIILKMFQGSQAVGIYGLTYKIHENLNVFAAYLMNSLLPVLALLAAKKKFNQWQNLFQKAFDLLFLLGFLMIIVVWLTAPIIITILTGSRLTSEIISLRILIFATGVSFLNHLTGYSIIALGEQVKSFYVAFLALGFNIIGNLIFIPKYSFQAAGIITVATEAIVLVLSSLVIYKKLHWFPKISHPLTTLRQLRLKKGRLFDED